VHDSYNHSQKGSDAIDRYQGEYGLSNNKKKAIYGENYSIDPDYNENQSMPITGITDAYKNNNPYGDFHDKGSRNYKWEPRDDTGIMPNDVNLIY
jgi:hypothetical protein